MMPPPESTEIKQGTEAEAAAAVVPVEAETMSTEDQRVVAVGGDAPESVSKGDDPPIVTSSTPDVPVDGNDVGNTSTVIHDEAPPAQPPIKEETTQEVEISGEWFGCGVVQSDGCCCGCGLF